MQHQGSVVQYHAIDLDCLGGSKTSRDCSRSLNFWTLPDAVIG